MAYKPGQWLAICDRCGLQFHSDKLQLTWDGLRVDKRCWETRHPQEFVHPIPESKPSWTSPEPPVVVTVPDGYLYVVVEYWDNLAVVPPASSIFDQYTNPVA